MLSRTFVLLLIGLLGEARTVGAASSFLDVDLPTDRPAIARGPRVAGRDTTSGIRGPGFSSLTVSGNPALPCRIVYIALPPRR